MQSFRHVPRSSVVLISEHSPQSSAVAPEDLLIIRELSRAVSQSLERMLTRVRTDPDKERAANSLVELGEACKGDLVLAALFLRHA